MENYSAPTSKGRVLYQGNSETCTCYAIANAVADQLADKQININQSSFASILVDRKGSIVPVWPHFYDNYHDSILIMDDQSGEYYSIKITSVKQVTHFNDEYKYVLAYYTSTNDYHCVFVKEKSGNYYSCINSWGNTHNPYPKFEIHKRHNILWMVRVEFVSVGWYFIFFNFLKVDDILFAHHTYRYWFFRASIIKTFAKEKFTILDLFDNLSEKNN